MTWTAGPAKLTIRPYRDTTHPVPHREPVLPQRSAAHRLRLALLRLVGRSYPRPAPGHQVGPQGAEPSQPASPLAEESAVLLIRPDHLGDLLFLTPALHALRRAAPRARLVLLAGPWGAEAVRGNPDLDEVRLCRFPGFERRPKQNLLAPYRALGVEAAALRRDRFDAAVVLRYDHWWGAWLAAAVGIPRRIGYDWPETRPFLTEALPYLAGQHEVRQNARLLGVDPGRDLGPLRFHVAQAEEAWAGSWLAGQGYDPARPLVAIHPGAGAAVKQWPAAAWAAVAGGLARACAAQILLTGGPAERDLVAGVRAAMREPTLDASGQTSLGQLAALQSRCALVLGSDSGPLHLAVAAGAPTLHLYGPVGVPAFGPWGDPVRHRVLVSPWACVPCNRLDWPARDLSFHACMAAITPDSVLAAAIEMLSSRC